MRAFFAAAVVALLVAVSGCGTQTGAGLTDPASIAPAGSLAFASFEIAPQGAEKANFDAAFGKLLGADPETQLGTAFTKAVSTGGLDYATDMKPWLGDTIAATVTGVGQDSCDYALLIASTDDGKARAAIDKDLAAQHPQSRTYRDVSYEALADGTVNGIVNHYVVAGTEPAFKAVVDAAKDGKSLADSDQWKQSVGDRAAGKVGLGYLDLKGVLQSLASNLPGAQRLVAPLLLGMVQIHPFVGTLDAQPNSLVVDVSSPGTQADPRGPGAAASPLIDSLPGDSWLALALPKVGQTLGRLVKAVRANPLIGGQVAGAEGQIKAQTGIDIQRDVLATVGDLGLFVRGTTPKTVGGALVVQSPKPARLARTLRQLPALIAAKARGHVRVSSRANGFNLNGGHAPKPIVVRSTPSGAVVAYGEDALQAALHPQGTLGETLLFKKAAAVIGQRPTVFVDFTRALALAASTPRHRNDAHFQQALPHLRHVEYAAAGARRDNGLDVLRGVIGLR